MIETAKLSALSEEQITYGYVTIFEEESRFVFQTSESIHSTARICYIIFCAGWAYLLCCVLAEILPVWFCVIPFLLAVFYAFKTSHNIDQQPYTFFEVQKQPAQINLFSKPVQTSLATKPEPALISLKCQETYAFYAWLTYNGDDRHEAVYQIDTQDQTTVLLYQIGDGDTAKQIALFLGNLWDKPVMLRDENGQFATLLNK